MQGPLNLLQETTALSVIASTLRVLKQAGETLRSSQRQKNLGEDSVVPPGLESLIPLFPALKRWAKFGRPSGAAFSCASFHPTIRKRVLTHTLKRWAMFGRPSGAGFSAGLRRSLRGIR